MKISIITTAKIPHVGGMSTHVEKIFEYLKQMQHDVEIHSRTGGKNIKSGGALKRTKYTILLSIFYKIFISFYFNLLSKTNIKIYHDPFANLMNFSKSTPSILYVHGELANEYVALGVCNKNELFYNFLKYIEKLLIKKQV